MKVQDYDPVVDTAVGVAEDPNGNLKMLQVDSDGKLKVDSNIDLSGATVNISGDLVADVNTIEETLGAKTDAAAGADTGTMSLVALFKRGLAHLTSILGRIPSNLTVSSNRLQVDTGTVPVTDNGGSITVDGTVTATGPLTDTQLRLSPIGTIVCDTNGSAITSTVDGSKRRLDVIANVSFPATQAVSATSLPLPTGAATETTLSTLNTKIPTLTAASSRLLVDGSGVTQPVSGTVTATGPLTDTQLRATAVAVSGTVTATGPLTDTQLRASAVPVSGPLTDTQLRSSAVPVSGPLTDAQLRNNPVIITAQSSFFTEATGTAPSSSTEVLGQNAARKYLLIQNLSTAPFHISIGGTASTSSLRIDGGATLVFEGPVIPSQNIRMIQTTSSQSYYILHG